MAISFECGCGKKLKVKDELAGKKVKCPGCAKILLAPVPHVEEPEEIVEMLEEEPPVKPKKPAAKPADKPTPAWEQGKKKPAPKVEAEDDEDNEKPPPFWVFPNNEVVALARDGIWFESLKGDALKRAKKQLSQGDHPSEVLSENAGCIVWDAVVSIYCNQKLNGFSIHFASGDESVIKNFTPADKETRDEIIQEIADFLKPDWTKQTTKLTAVTATLLPGVFIFIDLILTAALAWVSTLVEDVEVQNRVGWRSTRGLGGIINNLHDLGPMWVGVIGAGIAVALMVWLLIRVINPPIEVTIARSPE